MITQLWAPSLHHQLMIHWEMMQNCRAALYTLPGMECPMYMSEGPLCC